MKTSLIKFYAVGLNEQNLAFNLTAFNNILQAGRFLQGNVERSITLNQPIAFGAPFQISAQNYYIFKKATYLLIQNTVDNRTYSRYGFINNFLELANGNYSVSYTLDDYTNYILHASDLGLSPNIDGFTERANVPLISYNNNQYLINTRQVPLTGKMAQNSIKTFFTSSMTFLGVDRALPNGWKCQLYSIDIPKYEGISNDGAQSHGALVNYNYKSDTFHLIERLNSNLYIRLYDEDGWSVPVVYNNGTENRLFSREIAFDITTQSIKWREYYAHRESDPDDSTILKIMKFDFLPVIDAWQGTDLKPYYTTTQQNLTNIFQIKTIAEVFPQYASYSGATRKILYVDKNLNRLNSADIFAKEQNTVPESIEYCKAVGISIFSSVLRFEIPNTIIAEQSQIIKQTNINNYYQNSLYRYTDEARQIKIKYLSAEIEIPEAQFIKDNYIYVEFSGDLETVILKYDNRDFPMHYRSNILASTGQNTAFFDLVHVRDYKAYKNAKITGAAGIAASAVGSVVALGSSIATNNVAGMVGALAGDAQGIMTGVQKLQGLTPAQLSPANGDYTLTQILNDDLTMSKIIFEISQPAPENFNSIMRYFEENGAAVSMPFSDYITNCQMEAYNAVKCAYMDITGIPQQAARRIADAFINGLTLWTATNVGDKKVINYPLISVGV